MKYTSLQRAALRKLFTATALATIGPGAVAQSSVTLYGIADAGLVLESGGAKGKVTKVTRGIASGTRLGFRGTEDLGGGTNAYFVLEMGVSPDTGLSTQGVNVNVPQGVPFGRLALVGWRIDRKHHVRAGQCVQPVVIGQQLFAFQRRAIIRSAHLSSARSSGWGLTYITAASR